MRWMWLLGIIGGCAPAPRAPERVHSAGDEDGAPVVSSPAEVNAGATRVETRTETEASFAFCAPGERRCEGDGVCYAPAVFCSQCACDSLAVDKCRGHREGSECGVRDRDLRYRGVCFGGECTIRERTRRVSLSFEARSPSGVWVVLGTPQVGEASRVETSLDQTPRDILIDALLVMESDLYDVRSIDLYAPPEVASDAQLAPLTAYLQQLGLRTVVRRERAPVRTGD